MLFAASYFFSHWKAKTLSFACKLYQEKLTVFLPVKSWLYTYDQDQAPSDCRMVPAAVSASKYYSPKIYISSLLYISSSIVTGQQSKLFHSPWGLLVLICWRNNYQTLQTNFRSMNGWFFFLRVPNFASGNFASFFGVYGILALQSQSWCHLNNHIKCPATSFFQHLQHCINDQWDPCKNRTGHHATRSITTSL